MNIVFPGKSRIAAIKFLDPNHMLMRFVEYQEDGLAIEVVEGYEVVRSTQINESNSD